ncbi:MAG TPA: MFS transporter [Bacteroidetes bacterium]|nr:MFS transporter [Bacteroidota bacterium]
MKHITRNVLILSLISLFNDASSEMLIPVMPLFLKSIGYTTVIIGILEGLAEATAGLSKIYFGNISDFLGKRSRLVQLGYAMSSVAKSLPGLSGFIGVIFSSRMLDKLGKGVRTGARDAMLSDEAAPENKGAVFGFRSALDSIGAAIGPALALWFLIYFPENYQTLFLLAFIPAAITLTLTFAIREKKILPSGKQKPTLIQSFLYWKKSTAAYRKIIAPLLLFALVNSSDAFLLLMLKWHGMSDTQVLLIYIFYNLVYASLSFPLGIIADKIGLKKMLVFGMVLYAIAYGSMSAPHSIVEYVIIFFIYGIYQAATDGVSKALITNLVPNTETASAIGFFEGTKSICILICNIVAGFVWLHLGAPVVFIIAAAGAVLTAVTISFQQLRRV